MSKWAEKFVVGLTGNIGTGKSVVRRMLEHLGAYGIDADSLSHRVIEKNAPGYKAVVNYFGQYILTENGEIDRKKLGRIVFSDPEALEKLEEIIHPIVDQIIDLIVKRAKHEVIVIEAIKLIESGLADNCDALWVTYTPFEIQLERLVEKRKMNEEDARQRILTQPPQEDKVQKADVVIENAGSYEDTWKQVARAWKQQNPSHAAAEEKEEEVRKEIPAGEIRVIKGKPRHSKEIADFINLRQSNGSKLDQDDIMASFGEKAYLLLQAGDQIVGVMGWQVENLIVRVVEIFLDPALDRVLAVSKLTAEMERASTELHCEAALVFSPDEMAELSTAWQELGYEQRTIESLKISAWKEAAKEAITEDVVLYFKQLRKDRILRPI